MPWKPLQRRVGAGDTTHIGGGGRGGGQGTVVVTYSGRGTRPRGVTVILVGSCLTASQERDNHSADGCTQDQPPEDCDVFIEQVGTCVSLVLQYTCAIVVVCFSSSPRFPVLNSAGIARAQHAQNSNAP